MRQIVARGHALEVHIAPDEAVAELLLERDGFTAGVVSGDERVCAEYAEDKRIEKELRGAEVGEGEVGPSGNQKGRASGLHEPDLPLPANRYVGPGRICGRLGRRFGLKFSQWCFLKCRPEGPGLPLHLLRRDSFGSRYTSLVKRRRG